jgi:hypothetical protein
LEADVLRCRGNAVLWQLFKKLLQVVNVGVQTLSGPTEPAMELSDRGAEKGLGTDGALDS